MSVKIISIYAPTPRNIPYHLLPLTMKGNPSKFSTHEFSKLVYVNVGDETEALENFIKEWITRENAHRLTLRKKYSSREIADKIKEGPQ